MGTMSMTDPAPLPRLGEVFFDVRSKSRSLRISWYADTGVAVLSIWQGGTCTGSFRLPMGDLPRLIEALQAGPSGSDGPGDNGAPAAGAMVPPAGYTADPAGAGSLHYLAGSAPQSVLPDRTPFDGATASCAVPALDGCPGYAAADSGGYTIADPGPYPYTDPGSQARPDPGSYPAPDPGSHGYPAPGSYPPAGPGSYPPPPAGYDAQGSGGYPVYSSRHGDAGHPAEGSYPDYPTVPPAPYGGAGPENLNGQHSNSGWDYRSVVSVGAGPGPLPESHPYGTPHENPDRRDETSGPPVPFG